MEDINKRQLLSLSIKEQLMLAKDPETTHDTLLQMAKSDMTSIAVLLELFRKTDKDVRGSALCGIAESPYASPMLLVDLEKDFKQADTFVQVALAKNPSIPFSVGMGLANSPETDTDVLVALSSHNNTVTRNSAISNLEKRGIDVDKILSDNVVSQAKKRNAEKRKMSKEQPESPSPQ